MVAAVREAGALASQAYRGTFRSWEKRPGDPVTEVDHAVNDRLFEILSDARPDYGWISEETPASDWRPDGPRSWFVDPIDGTRALVRGEPFFTVSVGLVEGGQPVAGAILNPATGELCEGYRGAGVRWNGVAARVSDRDEIAGSRIAGFVRELPRTLREGPLRDARLERFNSVAYRLALVAAGQMEATLSASAKSCWDLAAGQFLVEEAGGRATTLTGPLPDYRTPFRAPSLLAANPRLHARLSAAWQAPQGPAAGHKPAANSDT